MGGPIMLFPDGRRGDSHHDDNEVSDVAVVECRTHSFQPQQI
jgi:hypothetical protein